MSKSYDLEEAIMFAVPRFIDTKAIVIKLMWKEKNESLSLSRLQALLSFLYENLHNMGKLGAYQMSFDVNYDEVERMVAYNEDIFLLDTDVDAIYLRRAGTIEKLAQDYPLDKTLSDIICDFALSA